MYAAIGAASLPAGHVTEATARIPSAIAAALTVLFAFATLRRFIGENQAFAAAVLLPVSLLWLDKAPSAEIDILQLAWVSAAMFSFLRAYVAKEAGRRRTAHAWWVAALLCVTGGFLTKWTAPAFFYLAVVPFLLWRRRVRWLFAADHLIAVGVFVGLCATWAYLVSAQIGWNTLAETVRQEAEQRFAPKANGKPYPWTEALAFPAVVLGAALPWSIPALAGLRSSCRAGSEDGRRQMLIQLLHCWAWPNLLFWSLPAQHHVRYVLPIAPAISLLGVITLADWAGRCSLSRRLMSPRVALAVAILAWATVKIVFVEQAAPQRTAGRGARETGEQLARLVPPGEILYLCRLKDEGVLFYYGRPARRLTSFDVSQGHAAYALMLDAEWNGERFRIRAQYIAELRDQQGAPIHLVRLLGPDEDDDEWPPDRPIPPTSSPSVP